MGYSLQSVPVVNTKLKMFAVTKFTPCIRSWSAVSIRAMSAGSGSGKGGGDGGSIRKAGGKFGEMEAAQEDQYFRKLQAAQLGDLKKSMSNSLSFHKEQLEDHEKAIEHHKKKIAELEELAKKTE